MASEQYKLRSVLSGHSMDVKCVSVVPEPPGSIITASRDKTARLWYPHEDMSYSVRKVFKGHPKYVSCVTYSGPSEEHPSGLIYTGCQDGKIRAYLPDIEDPFFQLDGHAENVTDIFVGTFGTIISGSWDKTAKVWVGRKCSMTLTGHQAAVWAVAILPEVGIMVSAGADKTVRLWKTGKLVNTLTGHTDAVRGIAVVSKEEFLTCSNDATVRRWSAQGEATGTYYGHQNYIYSISLMPNGRDWVTSGEDRTMRVWENNEIVQTIYLPAISVWSVCALQNGDIAASTSDGMVRMFSKDPSRQASQDIQELFKEEISKCSLAAQQELGGVKLSDLPGPEALYEPGKKDGQTKMVRTGDKVAVHSWDMASQQWTKVGDVMGASGGSEAESGKKLYMGKEYDFVFDIEIDEPKSTLKLPYNVTEDPWMAAQKFIHEHGMSQLYLDEIANHIVNNTKGQVLGVGAGGSADPLTGGAAYTPVGVSSGAGFTGGAAADPFTGSGAYTSGSGGVSTGSSRPPPDPWMEGAYRTEGGTDVNGGHSAMEVDELNPYFPQTSYLNFDQMPKADPIVAKLKEFNGSVEPDQQIDTEVLEKLPSLATKDNADDILVAALFKMDVPSINDIWPVELIEKLFSKFDPSDLGAALLVCRTWKQLGEQPKLWEWVSLKVTQRNLAAMPQILAMERLKTQKEIHIFDVSEELLKAIVSHLALKALHMKCSFSSADPALLARVIHKMEECNCGGKDGVATLVDPYSQYEDLLTPQQVQAIFNFFGSDSKLRKLSMPYMPYTVLSAVDSQVLARAVTKLEEFDIEESNLNDEQCQTIFQFLNGESKLKVLNISRNDLHSVQPEVLARAIVKFEEVDLTLAELTAQQCQQVFQLISCESQLKKLGISHIDLSPVHPEQLAKAIVKLEEVTLDDTQLTPEQCQSIFKAATYCSKMRILSIAWNDLTSVDPDVLARVVVKLEKVGLGEARLTAAQYQTIIKLASSNSSKLNFVSMWHNDLSPVDPEELAKAVSKLEEVEFIGVKLTVVQCQAIVEFASSDYSKLNRVCITGTDLSSAAPEALAKAVTKLEEARFAHTKLTPQQSQAMFKIASCESKLKILDMEGNDLSSVDPKTLGKVIHKMEDVYLRGTKLTNEQCQVIFEVASCESKLKKIQMCGNNLSFTDPESLGKVLNEVEVAWLTNTQLTSLQCEIIFKFVLGDTKLINLFMAYNDFSKVNPETLDKVEAKFKYFK